MTVCGGVSLRKAALADREAIYRIHVDSVRVLCGTYYSKEQLEHWFEDRSPDDYTAAIGAGGDWIALIEQEPIGFIEFFTKSISMLYVNSRFSDRGVGRILLDFALATMPRQQGRISLEALLNAVPFYKKFGFEKVGDGQIRRESGLVIETVLMERLEGRWSGRSACLRRCCPLPSR